MHERLIRIGTVRVLETDASNEARP